MLRHLTQRITFLSNVYLYAVHLESYWHIRWRKYVQFLEGCLVWKKYYETIYCIVFNFSFRGKCHMLNQNCHMQREKKSKKCIVIKHNLMHNITEHKYFNTKIFHNTFLTNKLWSADIPFWLLFPKMEQIIYLSLVISTIPSWIFFKYIFVYFNMSFTKKIPYIHHQDQLSWG